VSERSLKGWMQTLISYVRSGQPDLTNRQMALMLLVYLTPGPHTVRGLANILGVSKPVITRALNTLGTLGYLRRVRDEADRRNVFVAKTSTGQEFLEGFERNIEQEGPLPAEPPRNGDSSSSTAERFTLSGAVAGPGRARPRLSPRHRRHRARRPADRAALCAADDPQLRRARRPSSTTSPAGRTSRRAARRMAYHFWTLALCSASVLAKTCPPVPSATK
jgi:DNA-binding MarR family transcriptional regulator